MSRPPQTIGPYQIESRLGAGNMGVVFKVRHPELDATYALKVLRTDLCSPNDLARFQREIELVAAASTHPNVVGIHTANQEQGKVYYVMDLVEGEDLQKTVARGPLPARQAARYALGVAEAVSHLHTKGIVHRDIKPANVLVDPDDRPLLSDFGLARAFMDDQNRLTRTGEMIGTPYYMSPEQASGKPAGPPADVYAVGMLLFTLLAGEPAVTGASTLEVLDQIRRGAHRPLAALAPQTPAALAELCADAMAMDPASRPSGAALASRLQDFLGGGGGPSAGSVRRRRLVLGGAGVAVALAVGAALLARALEPPPADLAPSMAAAEDLLAGAGAQLGSGEGDAALAESLARARASLESAALPEPPPAELPALRGRLLAREGEAALASGDLTRARTCLEEALGLIDAERGPGLRELRRVGLAALRGGLEALEPGEGGDLAEEALRDLARAREREPERADLLEWRVVLAVRTGQPQEALADLEAHPDPEQVPAGLRAQVWLSAGRLDEALALLPALEDPRRIAQVHYEAGVTALREQHLELALEHLPPAVARAPDDPRRAEALRLAQSALRQASSWTRGADPRVLGNALWREVRAATIVRQLDPQFSFPASRVDAIYGALSEVGGVLRQETIEIVHALIGVVPDDIALYKVFASLSVDYGLPQPARDMALIRQGLTHARDPGDSRHLVEQLTVALYRSQLLSELTELANGVLSGDQDDRLKAFVAGRVGDLLRYQGQPQEARRWLDRTRKLDPDSFDLFAFEYAFHRVRFDRDQQPADRDTALKNAWALIRDYEPESWDDWLPDICVWTCVQEETRGSFEPAAEALQLLVRFHPDQLRWGTHRLVLLAQLQPFPRGRVIEGLDALERAMQALVEDLEATAEADPNSDRYDVLMSRAGALRRQTLRHLRERLDLEQLGPFQQGLLLLEQELARIEGS